MWALDQEDPPEKEMAIHWGILAWRIPRTEQSGKLQSMGSQSQTWFCEWKTKYLIWGSNAETNPKAPCGLQRLPSDKACSDAVLPAGLMVPRPNTAPLWAGTGDPGCCQSLVVSQALPASVKIQIPCSSRIFLKGRTGGKQRWGWPRDAVGFC